MKQSNEMIMELSKLLGLEKTAAKKKEDEKEEKKDKKEKDDKKEEEKDKKEEKDDKDEGENKKEASAMMNVISNLVKLAEELDDAGAKEASDLVDDALQVIVKNIKEAAEIPEEVDLGPAAGGFPSIETDEEEIEVVEPETTPVDVQLAQKPSAEEMLAAIKRILTQ